MSNDVFVWIEQNGGEADPISWQAMTAARTLANALGGEMVALVMGEHIDDLSHKAAHYGADRVLSADDSSLNKFRLEPYAAVLTQLAVNETPAAIIMGASASGLELSAYVAARLQVGLASDCTELSVDSGQIVATRPALIGNLIATVRFIQSGSSMMTIRRNVFPSADQDTNRSVKVLSIPVSMTEEDISTKIESVETAAGKVSLTDASIIVSGGRGVGGPEGFKPVVELAEALGGALGASRAAVDAGWIPYPHQVGQTGKTVQPDLYIACGISGAIQHLAGMKNAKVIVAINKDGDVPLFKYARYGIVGDLFEYLPALVEEVKSRFNH